eukprot:TRINITY_DN6105_c3_g1_i1.p1 TRINITY_DN6105_c3_g1~~TRINITY_DN6105_c3_g1_i1.p1  ORF type:complete len:1929 (+),score=239.93 TRINITY_DN6105_c3_g1_i1:704-5788(+)
MSTGEVLPGAHTTFSFVLHFSHSDKDDAISPSMWKEMYTRQWSVDYMDDNDEPSSSPSSSSSLFSSSTWKDRVYERLHLERMDLRYTFLALAGGFDVALHKNQITLNEEEVDSATYERPDNNEDDDEGALFLERKADGIKHILQHMNDAIEHLRWLQSIEWATDMFFSELIFDEKFIQYPEGHALLKNITSRFYPVATMTKTTSTDGGERYNHRDTVHMCSSWVVYGCHGEPHHMTIHLQRHGNKAWSALFLGDDLLCYSEEMGDLFQHGGGQTIIDYPLLHNLKIALFGNRDNEVSDELLLCYMHLFSLSRKHYRKPSFLDFSTPSDRHHRNHPTIPSPYDEIKHVVAHKISQENAGVPGTAPERRRTGMVCGFGYRGPDPILPHTPSDYIEAGIITPSTLRAYTRRILSHSGDVYGEVGYDDDDDDDDDDVDGDQDDVAWTSLLYYDDVNDLYNTTNNHRQHHQHHNDHHAPNSSNIVHHEQVYRVLNDYDAYASLCHFHSFIPNQFNHNLMWTLQYVMRLSASDDDHYRSGGGGRKIPEFIMINKYQTVCSTSFATDSPEIPFIKFVQKLLPLYRFRAIVSYHVRMFIRQYSASLPPPDTRTHQQQEDMKYLTKFLAERHIYPLTTYSNRNFRDNNDRLDDGNFDDISKFCILSIDDTAPLPSTPIFHVGYGLHSHRRHPDKPNHFLNDQSGSLFIDIDQYDLFEYFLAATPQREKVLSSSSLSSMIVVDGDIDLTGYEGDIDIDSLFKDIMDSKENKDNPSIHPPLQNSTVASSPTSTREHPQRYMRKAYAYTLGRSALFGDQHAKVSPDICVLLLAAIGRSAAEWQASGASKFFHHADDDDCIGNKDRNDDVNLEAWDQSYALNLTDPYLKAPLNPNQIENIEYIKCDHFQTKLKKKQDKLSYMIDESPESFARVASVKVVVDNKSASNEILSDPNLRASLYLANMSTFLVDGAHFSVDLGVWPPRTYVNDGVFLSHIAFSEPQHSLIFLRNVTKLKSDSYIEELILCRRRGIISGDDDNSRTSSFRLHLPTSSEHNEETMKDDVVMYNYDREIIWTGLRGEQERQRRRQQQQERQQRQPYDHFYHHLFGLTSIGFLGPYPIVITREAVYWREHNTWNLLFDDNFRRKYELRNYDHDGGMLVPLPSNVDCNNDDDNNECTPNNIRRVDNAILFKGKLFIYHLDQNNQLSSASLLPLYDATGLPFELNFDRRRSYGERKQYQIVTLSNFNYSPKRIFVFNEGRLFEFLWENDDPASISMRVIEHPLPVRNSTKCILSDGGTLGLIFQGHEAMQVIYRPASVDKTKWKTRNGATYTIVPRLNYRSKDDIFISDYTTSIWSEHAQSLMIMSSKQQQKNLHINHAFPSFHKKEDIHTCDRCMKEVPEGILHFSRTSSSSMELKQRNVHTLCDTCYQRGAHVDPSVYNDDLYSHVQVQDHPVEKVPLVGETIFRALDRSIIDELPVLPILIRESEELERPRPLPPPRKCTILRAWQVRAGILPVHLISPSVVLYDDVISLLAEVNNLVEKPTIIMFQMKENSWTYEGEQEDEDEDDVQDTSKNDDDDDIDDGDDDGYDPPLVCRATNRERKNTIVPKKEHDRTVYYGRLLRFHENRITSGVLIVEDPSSASPSSSRVAIRISRLRWMGIVGHRNAASDDNDDDMKLYGMDEVDYQLNEEGWQFKEDWAERAVKI